MDQPQTILVGTDFSDISDEALRAAALYAKMFKARVLVTHVFDPTPNVPPVVWSRPDLLERSVRVEIEDAIRETLTGKTAELLKGVPEVELSVIQHPSPGRALVEMAEDEGADLLILGSHGRSGLSRAFLGSVAERVVRHAPCPVLVVRGRCDNKPKDGD
ncbi:MAG: universal stress protein [Myxococcales bacterium]|jgi:nucleotide-binding universal stress UspA family protein|nr:universal stress protein [Deltaproteobacteria bacterium]MBW2188325.1 universal stress protein [Deltaproteobacteria bacterium]MBW2405040.1 universal stress protein [Deltaproteobacteria bacterium]NOQ84239.1 universal stress protein [Myxococcales bacterium]RLB52098.1 MAG: universal stress protein [Deltaproteobacteria bacterium]